MPSPDEVKRLARQAEALAQVLDDVVSRLHFLMADINNHDDSKPYNDAVDWTEEMHYFLESREGIYQLMWNQANRDSVDGVGDYLDKKRYPEKDEESQQKTSEPDYDDIPF